MLCLSSGEAERLEEQITRCQEQQTRCNQVVQDYNSLAADRNQLAIDQASKNYLSEAYDKMLVGYKELEANHKQLVIDYSEIKLGNSLMGCLLTITYGVLLVKWLIKVERKMSKRDEPKRKPITFTKRTNPKKGDRL